MMADLRSFSKTMQLRGAAVSTNADALVRKVALAVDAAVVLATPVDTGQARSNWQVSLGSAATGTIPPYSPGKSASTAGANAQAAIDQGTRVIGGRTAGVDIHITNNLDYIDELNNGKSLQAPAGFVEEAVLVGVRTISQFGSIVVTQSGNTLTP